MIVKLKNVLPHLLCPAIERFVCTDEPSEYIGDLYGYRVENPSREKTCIITDVFHYHTPDADEETVYELERDDQQELCHTLEELLEDHKRRLGDFHAHVTGSGIIDAYKEVTQNGFIHQFQRGVNYTKADRESMKKTGLLYMIIGFGKRKFDHRKPLYRCPDGKSLFGVTSDYAYAIAVWYYNRMSRRFQKAKVIVNGGNNHELK